MAKKIAFYGFIDQNIGGLCSGHFLAIQSYCRNSKNNFLFLSSPGWLEPGRLSDLTNLEVEEVKINYSVFFGYLVRKAQDWSKRGGFKWLFSTLILQILWREIGGEIRKLLLNNGCDAILIAGFQNPWKFPGVKVVSWTQGPVFGEGEWLLKHPFLSISHYGLFKYFLTLTGYLIRGVVNWFDFRKSEIIICGSSWAKTVWRKWGCPKSKLIVLPYAYKRMAPRIWKNGGPHDKSFLHLGRIVPRKRIELLIEAFSDPRLSSYSLTLVGQFVFPRGKKLVDKLPPNIFYRPQVDFSKVGELYDEHKFLIQVSENENLGSSIMEAMALGVPVLLNRSNGTADYVPKSDWHFFDKYEAEDLVQAIMRASRATEGMECDWEAIEEHKKHFSPEVVGSKLAEIIDG